MLKGVHAQSDAAQGRRISQGPQPGQAGASGEGAKDSERAYIPPRLILYVEPDTERNV